MTDVAVSMPAVSYAPGNTVTVTVDQAAAKITSMTVHVLQFVPDDETTPAGVPPLMVYGPDTGVPA